MKYGKPEIHKDQTERYKADYTEKRLLSDNTLIAPLIGSYFLNDKKAFRPEDFHDKDPNRQTLTRREKRGTEQTFLRETQRDAFRQVSIKVADGFAYFLIGLEAQSYQCWDMALRAADYDLMDYRIQAEKIQEEHQKKKERDPVFRFGRLHRGDFLNYCGTLVIWFSADPWEGPRDLNELVRFPEGYAKKKFSYPLHLIEPCAMSDEELMNLGEGIGCPLVMIRNSESQEALKKAMVKYRKEFSRMSVLAADVVNSAVSLGVAISQKDREEGEINMCKAMEQMLEQARQEASVNGIAIGEARKRARAEAANRKVVYHLFQLGMPVGQIAAVMSLPAETISDWIEEHEYAA